MDIDKFREVYRASRNGANDFFFNPLYRQMAYSDGVRDLAETGCYWLLDIIGTECVEVLRECPEPSMCIVTAVVNDGKAKLSLTDADDQPPLWERSIEYTDMPDGTWNLYLADEGERFTLILPSEY
jgi:hypothetical protein